MKNIWIEKKKNILIMLFFFITMMVVSGFTSMAVRAEGETGNTWNPEAGIYVISTVADLDSFRSALICANNNDYAGKKITLNNDIVIDGDHPLTSLYYGGFAYFNGTFDGQGHSISGFNDIQTPLFQRIGSAGKVYNLNLDVNLENCATTSVVQRIATLTTINNGKIINCSVAGSIKTASTNFGQVGGLVGQNTGSNAQITNCYSRVNIEANSQIGGLVANNAATIKNCYVTGNLVETGSKTIYPIAYCNNQTLIQDCYYQDTINTNLATTNNFGTLLTETQFKDSTNSASNFPNWNFEKEWKMDATNGGYPSLRYQLPEGNSSEIQVKAVVKIKDKVVPDTDINTNAPDFLKADIESITLVAADGKTESQTIIDGYHAKLELRDPDKGIQNPLTFTGVASAENNFDNYLNSFLTQYKLVYDDSGANAYTLKFFSNEERMGVLGEDFSANEPAFTFNSNITYSDDQKAAAIAATETRIQESLAYYLPADVSGHDAVFGSGNNQYGSWLIFTSARAGYTPHAGFFDECYQAFAEKYTASGKVTGEGKPLNEGFDANEVAKDALAITAMGYDARNVAGYNLIEMLTNGKNPSDGYFVGQVSSFAIDSYDYLPGTQEAYAVELAKKALAGASTGNDPLIDMYIMGSQPLAAYYDPDAQEGTDLYYVKQAMETVFIPYFSRLQGYTGVFYSGISYNNPWSNAQVYIMLGMADTDIFQTTFIKNGFSMLDSLAPVSQSYGADQGQIARGYEAVVRAYRNENQIFDCTDVLNSTVRVNNAIAELPAVDTITDDTTKAAAQEKLTAVDTLLSSLTLSDAQKNSIDKTKYDAVKAKLTTGTPSDADQAAAKVVTDQIAALGTITLEKEGDVTAARAAYTALTDVQKALVTADTLKILTDAEAAIDALKPQTGTVTIDVERFTIGQGFYKEPVTMNYTKGETVFVLLSKLVGETNILGSSSYVTGIKGTDAGSDVVAIPDYIVTKLNGGDTAVAKNYGNTQTDSALGTASYSAQGGWMFLVNNQSPKVGMGDYKVSNGDVIRIAFSYCGYGADLTGFEYGVSEPKVVLGNRDELLKALSAVNTANRETLLANAAVKTAYDNAIAVAKDMTETTENANMAAAALTQAIADMNTEDPEVKAVVDQISKLPTKENLTLADKDKVAKVSDAYKKLSDTQKSKVTNLETLTDAEAKIAELEAASASEADQAAAKKVSDLIAGIKAADQLKAGDKAELMKIRRAYQTLTETQKGLISEETSGKLTAAEAAIGELEKNVPPVKSDTKEIEVTGLPEAVKKLVVNDKKDDATVTAAAKKAAEDANMAEVEVIALYGIKPEMTDDELAEFNADDTRYVTMTLLIPEDKRGAESYRIYHKKTNGDIEWIDPVVSEDGTCLIFKVNSFSDFGIMAKMKAAGETEDEKAAKAVDDLITALPTTASLALTDKSKVTEARAAYDKLTADQKALVTNFGSLTAVESKLAELEKAASEADKAAAKKVTDQISALPVVGSLAVTDKTKVTEARAAYTALTDTQKTLVTNLTTLTAAEAKITELEKAEADKAAVKKVTDQITALGTITKWEQKASVEAARAAYNQLTVAQKALVTTDTLNLLKAAEAAVEKLKPTSGTITIDVERFTIGQGFFVEPVTVSIKEGEKAYEAIQGLVGSDNLIGDSNYLRAIKGADTGTATIPDYIVSKIGGANSASANAYGQKYTGSTLGEFDYSKYSGWMYLVNNVTPSVGINDYVLKDGDVLRFAFTYWGYGTDLTGLEFGTNKVLANIANKDNLLEAIAAVNANKAANLSNETIKSAYNAAMSVVQDMTATQKATNDAATALKKAVTDSSGTDKAAAKTVTDKIAALPTVSKLILTDKDAVTAARSAYDALTATQKALVTNLTTLTAAEAKITELEKEAANTANKAAAKAVTDKIAALHSGTALLLGEKADVVAARIAYNALTEAQKALVTNLSTLVAAEARIAELEKATPVAKDEKTGIEAVGLPAGTAIKVGDESKDTDKTGEALKAAEKQGIKDAKIVSLYAIKPDMSDADLEKFNNDKSSYVTLTIPLSTEQQGYDSYVVYHKKSDGSVEWITPTLSADKKSLIFKVNSFSEFGVMGSKKSTTPGDESVSCSYQTQIENVGWQEVKKDGATSGTFGKSLRLEGIKINVAAEGKDLGVEYQTHVQNLGWQGFKSNGTMSGTEGKALRLEGIQIRLTGKDAAKYDIYYRVHAQNYGWLDWAKNGESAGTEGFGYRLEGIEIKVVEKNAAAPGETEQPFITGNIHINYQTQIQNVGWQELKKDGAMSGTSGQSLRLEGIKINVENAGYDVGVSYQTHVENIGWQESRTNGKMSGTEGESKRLEGIRISLTGDDAGLCDVYYQVHAQNTGWMNWAKNGESAGTEGFGYRLEGIRIVVVPKGSPAPSAEMGTIGTAFVSNN